MRTYQALVFLLVLLVARTSGSAPANAPSSATPAKDMPEHLRFVRQFSSIQDVERDSHPVLNRALDVAAGPKEAEPVIDALQEPYSVTTDAVHRVFVTDVRAAVVHIFDFVHSKYSLLRGGDRLSIPLGVAADREGNIFVSDGGLHTVLVYDSRGKFSHYLKKTRGRESYFETPRGIAVDPATEHIYVCDTTRHMLIVLDTKGHVLALLGPRGGGTGPGEFRFPTQVAVAGDEIAVLDAGNSRVQMLDTRGHFRKEVRLAAASNRTGLAMDNDRNLYVTDPELNRLQVFNHDGRRLYQFGQQGSGTGQFNGISGLWVDSGHCLYVVDTGNKRVQLFQITGSGAPGC